MPSIIYSSLISVIRSICSNHRSPLYPSRQTQPYHLPLTQQSQHWFIDSSASHHLIPDATNLMDATSSHSGENVFLGNGQGLPIQSSGFASFKSSYNPSVTLSKTYYMCPLSTKNLFSVSLFVCNNHVYFEFHPLSVLLDLRLMIPFY